MIAFAMHLFRTVPNLKHVAIHPDGEHGKRFDFKNWLKYHGYSMTKTMGSTAYGGLYASAAAGQTVLINPKSGLGDVVADISGRSFVAECKGGIITLSTPDNYLDFERVYVKRLPFHFRFR